MSEKSIYRYNYFLKFQRIARVLGMVISEKKDLRLSVMASLRKLIQRSVENNNQNNIEELSKYAKNYLPILFNLYTIKPQGSDEEGQRLACYETIKVTTQKNILIIVYFLTSEIIF